MKLGARDEPEGLLAGVTGLNPLRFAEIVGFANGLPPKLLLIEFVISEDLELGFRGRVMFEFADVEAAASEDLLEGRAIRVPSRLSSLQK